MTKITNCVASIRSIHEAYTRKSSCMHELFKRAAGLKGKAYKAYTNFTRNIYFKLGGVVGYTYDWHAHPNMNA